jgi:hypothetical protein
MLPALNRFRRSRAACLGGQYLSAKPVLYRNWSMAKKRNTDSGMMKRLTIDSSVIIASLLENESRHG